MKRLELINLSIANIGLALAYNVLTMNLQSYFEYTIFSADSSLAGLLAFTVVTIAFAAGAFTYLFAGWLSDKTYHRWGRRPYMLVSIPGAIALILLGFNYVSLGIAAAFILLSALATCFTVTYRLMYTSYFALYQDLTDPEDRAKTTITFSIFALIGVAGAIVMPLAPKNASADNILITVICGVALVATVLYSYFFGPREKLNRTQKEGEKHPSVLHSIRETFKNKDFKNYALSALFAGFAYSMVMFILKPFIDWKTDPVATIDFTPRLFQIPIDWWIIIISLLPIALIIFWFCGYASKRWGKRKFFSWALLIGAITFPPMIFLTNQGSPISLIIQLYVAIIIILFVVVTILSLQNAILMDVTPAGKEATYTGVFFFLVVIPFPFASQLAGLLRYIFSFDVGGFWLGNESGSDFAYGLMIVIMGISLLISWLFLRRVKYEEVKER